MTPPDPLAAGAQQEWMREAAEELIALFSKYDIVSEALANTHVTGVIAKHAPRAADARALAAEARALVDRQATYEGLWCEARTAMEGYLQQELRKLHAAVEACPAQPPAGGEAALLREVKSLAADCARKAETAGDPSARFVWAYVRDALNDMEEA